MQRIFRLLAIFPIVFASACCFWRVNRQEFASLAVAAKVDKYRAALAQDCLRQDRVPLLMDIAAHGDEAYAAVEQFLDHPVAGFQVEDALLVILYASNQCRTLPADSLRRKVQSLAKSTDAEDANVAERVLETIARCESGGKADR